MLVIVGLGNPGEKYESTRHNVGFRVLDRLASELNVEFEDSKYIPAQFAENGNLELIKPKTYVNESGKAVSAVQAKHTVELENFWVVHDDTEIPLGEIRIKRGGTSGGHNGIKSIDETVGTDYWRVRIGVGRPADKNINLANFILSNFTTQESSELTSVIDRTVEYLIKSIADQELQPKTFNAKTKK